MAKCEHCPIRESDHPCLAETTRHRRFCEHAAAGHAGYSALLRGEIEPTPVPSARAPSLVARAGYLAEAAVAVVASGGKTVTHEEQARRMTICRACEYFDGAAQKCRRCTCYMPLKTRLAAMHCPLSPPKW
jgi:hypothetical protein